ncbi:hypothetical protein Bbelb_206520 [Branchiostoma belcheri]|nr:hypothetical protein Bbelb_206520 [Branchiostoma belcheri]
MSERGDGNVADDVSGTNRPANRSHLTRRSTCDHLRRDPAPGDVYDMNAPSNVSKTLSGTSIKPVKIWHGLQVRKIADSSSKEHRERPEDFYGLSLDLTSDHSSRSSQNRYHNLAQDTEINATVRGNRVEAKRDAFLSIFAAPISPLTLASCQNLYCQWGMANRGSRTGYLTGRKNRSHSVDRKAENHYAFVSSK